MKRQRTASKLGGAYQYLLMDKNTQYVAGGDTINYDKKCSNKKMQLLPISKILAWMVS
ncbi:hypothetical protein BY457_1333 [Marinilabilia salmonicolor]|jgi:hypothetical protein|uniref:hypothetical protein n=1 Tax=Marinilabilia salmonicolor TaxID=989 RepID=UPI000D451618|nr:hypothetical protein [Marinilabilia salmonicolor]PRY88192.1 hypothetical protein BY457_1333 [Marinilabilia salmonicolor]